MFKTLNSQHAATIGLKLGIHSQAYIIYLKAMASDLIFKLEQLTLQLIQYLYYYN